MSSRNALLYGRLSLERADEDGTKDGGNVSRQLQLAKAHAEKMGWTVAGSFRDDSISAAGKKDRAGFNSLIEAIEHGDGDVVVTRSLDRISRNRADTSRFFEVAQKHGVLIATYTGESYAMDSASGILLAEIMSAVARAENDTKSERSREAHMRRREAGKPWGPNRPFGLDKDGKVISEEAAIINTAVEEVLEGRSLRSITEEWTKRGIKTRRGGDWRQSSLSNYLRNPAITGLMSDRTTEGAWEAVVPRKTWEYLQVFLSDPSRGFKVNRRGRGTSERLLAGLAIDGQGRVIGTGKSSNGGYPVYRTRTRNDAKAPGKVTRKAEDCDEAVIKETLWHLSGPLGKKVAYKTEQDADRVEQIRGQLADIASERDKLGEAVASGDLSVADMTAITKGYAARESELKAELGRVRTSSLFEGLDLWDKNRTLNALVKNDYYGMRSWWDGLPLTHQRAVLKSLFSHIVIQNGRGVAARCILRDDL